MTLIWHTLFIHRPICGSTLPLMPAQEIPESVFVSMQLMHGFWMSRPPLPLVPRMDNSILLSTSTSTDKFEPSSVPRLASLSYKLLASTGPCKLKHPWLCWSIQHMKIHTCIASLALASSNRHPFSSNDSRDPDSIGKHSCKLFSAIYY